MDSRHFRLGDGGRYRAFVFMTEKNRTGTAITPVFSGPELSVYRMFVSKVATAYDGDDGAILKDIWCVKYEATDSFYWHCDDFRSAIAELRNHSSDFHSVVKSRITEFSNMLAYAMDLGRVVSRDCMWDEYDGITDMDRDQYLDNTSLIFTCIAWKTVGDSDSADIRTRYNYNVDSDVLKVVERHKIQNGR